MLIAFTFYFASKTMIQNIKAALEMKSCIRGDYFMQTDGNFII